MVLLSAPNFVLLLLLSVNLVSAQSSDNAIGLRFGGGNGFGTEISFQHALTDLNRLELDLGMFSRTNYSAWSLAGIYQWVWKIDDGFDWFAGFGGRIGSYSWSGDYSNQFPNGTGGSGILLAAAGNVGLEYTFPMRIQLGLDYRPEIKIINHGDAFGNNIALSVRYRF